MMQLSLVQMSLNLKGFLGLFKKKSVEVVAGFDEPVSKNRRNSSPIYFIAR